MNRSKPYSPGSHGGLKFAAGLFLLSAAAGLAGDLDTIGVTQLRLTDSTLSSVGFVPGGYDLQVLKNGGRDDKSVSNSETYALAFDIAANALPVTLQNPVRIGTDFVLSFSSQSGRSYEVQSIDSLGSGTWHFLTNLVGNGSLLTVTNHNPYRRSALVPG